MLFNWSKRFQFSVIAIFFCAFAIKVSAQPQLHFDRIGRSEGLSQSTVNCMLRDRNGVMWFGTQEGLNRYDGKKFRLFQNQPADSSTLSNNYILSVCEDKEGFLWIGTMAGGLNRFNAKTEQFRVFQHSEELNSISENTVWAVLSDGDRTIWAGTSKGMNRYDKKTGQFSVFTHRQNDESSIIADMVTSLYKDLRGNIWAGTAEGLSLFNPASGMFTPYWNTAEKEMPGANIIWSVSGTPDGKIITGTNNGVYLLDTLSGLFTLLLGSPGNTPVVAWSVAVEQDSTIWAGTANGLFRISGDRKNNQVYLNNPADQQSIADNNIWCMLADPAGFLWTGTKNGISKSRSTATNFGLLNDDPSRPLRLSSPKVMAVLEDRAGYLWIGTDGGGLNCISPGGKNVTVYNSKNSELQNDAVWALAEDREGNVWIGNYQGGLHVFRRSSGMIRAYPSGQNDPHALHNDRILALLADDEGKIWIGTRSGGLVCFDPGTNLFKNYLHSPGDTTSISGNTVLSLAMDREKRLWIGIYEGGLNRLIPGTEKFISYRKKTGDNSCLSDDNIWSILFDQKGRLWLGTQGGLNYSEYIDDNMSFRYLGTQHGLISNTVFGLTEDEQGNIWMSNFNGLSRLDIHVFETMDKSGPEKNGFSGIRPLIRTFDSGHGLQGLEFNQGAFHKGHSGLIYFGGSNGLNFFSAGDVKESGFMPPVILTDLKIFNKEVSILHEEKESLSGRVRIICENNKYFLPVSVSYIHELILTYHESVFSIEFASLDFTDPHKNQYAYRLTDFDKEWNFVGTQNMATYTNLNPGKYTFLVRGSNSGGIWNPEETVLKITIVPPLWKTWWFILSLIIVLLLFVFLIVRQAFLNQRRKAQKEREFVELQLKTIKSQIDPHFTFNALNTIASFIYSEEPDVTYDYFTRFALMIRNILNDNDKISYTLQEELDFVINYLELQKIRFKDKFEYTLHVDETIAPETKVPKMIIQTYTENAIKHGLMHRSKDGLLKIRVEKRNSCIQIMVEDNGVGREKAAELSTASTGRGLKIMEQIMELYRKLFPAEIMQKIEDLADSKGNATGTRVTLTICPQKKPAGKYRFFEKIRKYYEN
jgi:ligand-binding sensor domain-containing protein